MAPWRLSHLPPQMAFKPFQSIKCNTTFATYTDFIPGKDHRTCEMKSPRVWPSGCKQEGYGLNLANYIWQTSIVVEHGHSRKAWPYNRPPKEKEMFQSKCICVESNNQRKWLPKRKGEIT